MQAGVVAQIHRCEGEIARELGAVVMPVALPTQLISAKPMKEYQRLGARSPNRSGEPRPRELEQFPLAAQMHRDCERIASFGEVISYNAVQRRYCGLPLAGRFDLTQGGRHRAERKVHASADDTGDAANALVHDRGT